MRGDSGCVQWVVDILDYHIMEYPTIVITVLGGSLILTFCSTFVIVSKKIMGCKIYIHYLVCVVERKNW